MKPAVKKEIEKIFKNSNSSDELFDTFRIAIDEKLTDAELYKTLLWNKALSADEIAMFAKKICKEIPDISYKIYMAAAQIFESLSVYGIYHERAMSHFLLAAKAKPTMHEPYVAIAKMYNSELDVPPFSKVEIAVKNGLDNVHLKSKLCFSLVKLYKKTGNKDEEKYYQNMGERYQRELQ
jgi:hypothetical protein